MRLEFVLTSVRPEVINIIDDMYGRETTFNDPYVIMSPEEFKLQKVLSTQILVECFSSGY